jgi:hypothetical protein
MKKNGMRESILGDRNQVMGYISCVYLVPYVLYIRCLSCIPWNWPARLPDLKRMLAPPPLLKKPMCSISLLWKVQGEPIQPQHFHDYCVSTQESAQLTSQSALQVSAASWCQRHGTVTCIKCFRLQTNRLIFCRHKWKNFFIFSFIDVVSLVNAEHPRVSVCVHM